MISLKIIVHYPETPEKQDLFEEDDMFDDFENYENNKTTFTGYYAKIIQKYKEIQPDAKFFLLTMPREDRGHGEDHPMSRILAD